MPESVQELTHDQQADNDTSQLLDEIESEARAEVWDVSSDDLGNTSYTVYVADPLNLEKPVVLNFIIHADGTKGTLGFMSIKDALPLKEDYEKFKAWLTAEKQKEQAQKEPGE